MARTTRCEVRWLKRLTVESIDRVNSSDGTQTTNPPDFQFGYSPALDGLRGASILVVMGFNAHLFWLQGGFVGVDIFFVLSGFLITALLAQEYRRTSTIGLKSFYFRRALRLLPALFALMLASIAYALVIQPEDKASLTLKGVLYALFYVANWAQVPPNPSGIGPLSHAWSLSVEEQFYIIWPLLLLLLLKLKSKRILLAILFSLVTISLLLNIWFWQTRVPYLRMYFGSDTRANEILIGCIAALLLSWGAFQRTDRVRRVFHSVALISLVGVFLSFFLVRFNGAFVYNGGFTLISIGVAFLILDLLLFPSALSRLLEYAPLVWIGKISYGLYLWHFPIFEASRRIFEGRISPVLSEIIGVALTFLVATASYYLLELRFLRLRHRFNTKDSAPPLLTPTSQPAAGI